VTTTVIMLIEPMSKYHMSFVFKTGEVDERLGVT
jgi:hypothetical protein